MLACGFALLRVHTYGMTLGNVAKVFAKLHLHNLQRGTHHTSWLRPPNHPHSVIVAPCACIPGVLIAAAHPRSGPCCDRRWAVTGTL